MACDDTQARLDALETESAHQGQIIEELSEVAAKQWKEIARLTEQLDRLKDKFVEMAASTDIETKDEPPPHY